MKITVNDELELNYELDGDPASEPVIVLTHGMGSSLRSWDTEVPHLRMNAEEPVPALAKHYAVLRWDVRGHGDSDKPPGPYSPEMHARDLAGLLRALGITSAHVGGNSMGGAITQRFVLDYPELVASAFLLCTSSERAPGGRVGAACHDRGDRRHCGGAPRGRVVGEREHASPSPHR